MTQEEIDRKTWPVKFTAMRKPLRTSDQPPKTPELSSVHASINGAAWDIFSMIKLPEVMIQWGMGVQAMLLESAMAVCGGVEIPDDQLARVQEEYQARNAGYAWPPYVPNNSHVGLKPYRVSNEYQLAPPDKEIDRATGLSVVAIPSGFKAILRACLLTAHSAFEVCVSDAWRVAVNLRPLTLAMNALSATNIKDRPDTDSPSIRKEQERFEKMVPLEWLAEFGFDLHRTMGNVLVSRKRVSFDSVKSAQMAYQRTFLDRNRKPPNSLNALFANAFSKLKVLEAARNLIAHRRGIVDQRFRNEVRRHNESLSKLELGSVLPADGEFVFEHVQAVVDFCNSLLKFVDDWLVNHTDPLRPIDAGNNSTD